MSYFLRRHLINCLLKKNNFKKVLKEYTKEKNNKERKKNKVMEALKLCLKVLFALKCPGWLGKIRWIRNLKFVPQNNRRKEITLAKLPI